MRVALSTLIDRLDDQEFSDTNIIPWGSPVPSFGDLRNSKVATLGLNPSNREFVDVNGNELDGEFRRFHTLASLGINQWSDTNPDHLELIENSCVTYFHRNPYDGWFRKLDYLISGTEISYYNASAPACHLDLIPYATACKWTELSPDQRSSLMSLADDTLGLLLRESPVRLIILNGISVVEQFQNLAGIEFEKQEKRSWALPRRSRQDVKGFSYKGVVRSLSGVELRQELLVLGFNHNIQSSFGITAKVTASIRNWITNAASKVLL